MLSKILTFCTVLAMSSARLVPSYDHYSPLESLTTKVVSAPSSYQSAPAHYSSAAAVSSQNVIRHDQHQILTAKILTSPVPYHAAPSHYSSAAAVSSQNIVRHDQPTKLIAASVGKLAISTPILYHAAPRPIAYHASPAPVAYHPAPQTKVIAQSEEIAYPKYEYSYSVADGHSGDNKQQQESRDGDVVKGSYSFHEADGSIRTVEYSADDHNGFNAVVHNTAPTAAPVHIKAAPLIVKAPVYAAPAPQNYHHHH